MIIGFGSVSLIADAYPNRNDSQVSRGSYKLKNGDLQGALHQFDKACRRGVVYGCLMAGTGYLSILKNKKKASPYFSKVIAHLSKGCARSNGEYCYELGMNYWLPFNKKTKQNKHLAEKYMKKSCNLGYNDGCISYRKMKNL